MQLERDVGLTITPTVPDEQENDVEKQVDELQGKLNQPIFCLAAAGLFSPQASLASLRLAAAALLVGIRQEEAMRSEMVKLKMEEEVRSTMLVASQVPSTGTYRGHCKLNSMAGKLQRLLVSC